MRNGHIIYEVLEQEMRHLLKDHHSSFYICLWGQQTECLSLPGDKSLSVIWTTFPGGLRTGGGVADKTGAHTSDAETAGSRWVLHNSAGTRIDSPGHPSASTAAQRNRVFKTNSSALASALSLLVSVSPLLCLFLSVSPCFHLCLWLAPHDAKIRF